MSYLIYTTESAAWARSDTEGQRRNLPYHRGEGTTRYVTAPQPTAQGEWALNVSGYDLTEDEQTATVPSSNLAQYYVSGNGNLKFYGGYSK